MAKQKIFDCEVILLRETWKESVAGQVGTFITFVAMIGLGVYLESAAMQWVGALLFFFIMFGRMVNTAKRYRMTIARARERLDELEFEWDKDQMGKLGLQAQQQANGSQRHTTHDR